MEETKFEEGKSVFHYQVFIMERGVCDFPHRIKVRTGVYGSSLRERYPLDLDPRSSCHRNVFQNLTAQSPLLSPDFLLSDVLILFGKRRPSVSQDVY